MRRRALAEVKASPRLKKRRRQLPSIWTRSFPLDLHVLRMIVPAVWFLIAMDGGSGAEAAARMFPFWAALLIVARWGAFCTLPDQMLVVISLPLDPAKYFAHLWKREAFPVTLLTLEAWMVFTLNGCGTGHASLLAALLALPAAVALSVGGLAVALLLALYANFGVTVLASVVGGLGLVGLALTGLDQTARWIVESIQPALLWATPAGWTVQGISAFAHQEWALALAFTGAAIAIIGTIPGNLLRFRNRTLAVAEAKVEEALAWTQDDEAVEAIPSSLLTPPEETLREGETIARAWLAGPGRTVPEPNDPPLRWLHRRLNLRGQMILQCLIGPSERIKVLLSTLARQSLFFLLALFLARTFLPKWAPQIYGWGIVYLTFLGTSTLGGRAAILDETFSRSRFLPAYGGLPIGDHEIRRMMWRSNSLDFLVYGPVVMLAVILGGMLLGYGWVYLLPRAAGGLLVLWLAQPVILTVRFMNTVRIRGLSSLIAFVLAIVGLGWAMCSIVLLIEWEAWQPWLACYAVLWGTAWWYRRRHARGRVDLMK